MTSIDSLILVTLDSQRDAAYLGASKAPLQSCCDVEVPNEALREMYKTGRASTIDGRDIRLLSVVTPEFANSLYALVKREKPKLVLEIGLAHGATALSITTALGENGAWQDRVDRPFSTHGLAGWAPRAPATTTKLAY